MTEESMIQKLRPTQLALLDGQETQLIATMNLLRQSVDKINNEVQALREEQNKPATKTVNESYGKTDEVRCQAILKHLGNNACTMTGWMTKDMMHWVFPQITEKAMSNTIDRILKGNVAGYEMQKKPYRGRSFLYKLRTKR